MEEHIYDELKRYIGFQPQDQAQLPRLLPVVEAERDAIVDDFYVRILRHPGAGQVFSGPEQVDRLKGTLRLWVVEMVTGPWDQQYYEKRARIGRVHVRVGLSQHYMFGAMNVIRVHLVRAALASGLPDVENAIAALEKAIDLELAIMLHTYREAMSAQIVRSERLAAYGQLAASIAHELRNPLGVMDSSLYLLEKTVGNDAAAGKHISRLRGQVELSSGIITGLLDLVRDVPSQPRAIAIGVLVDQVCADVRERWPGTVENNVPEDLPPMRVDPDQLVQVLNNLLKNASEAAGNTGHVELHAEVDDDHVRLVVSDNGPGVDPEVAGRIFEPLVTTKAQGIGLGLALCHRLVRENNGTLRLSEGRLSGASFEVRLPVASTSS